MLFKRYLPALILLIAVALTLSGCQPLVDDAEIEHQTVYASFYPIYAISAMLLKDVPEMELRLLIQPQDGCLRNYRLSDWDLYQAYYSADAVITGGRGLESFSDTLQNLGAEGPAVVTLFQALSLDNNGIHAESDDEPMRHIDDENPHAYLSARLLPDILQSMYANMLQLDPMYTNIYEENLHTALQQAEALIADYNKASQQLSDDIVPFALLNEALIYPINDLGLTPACRIDRESGTDFSVSEWADVRDQLDRAHVQLVFLEKQASDALKRQLQDAGYSFVLLDILSTGTVEQGIDGFWNAMQDNLSAIVTAFSH